MTKDTLPESIQEASRRIANAITPAGNVGAPDESGAYVASLTEAVMGITASLAKIAEALEGVADALDGIGNDIRSR